MRRTAVALAAGILAAGALAGGTARATTEDRWLHIRIEEHGGSGENVRVNVPLSMVDSMAPYLKDMDTGGGKLRLNDKDLDAVQLRKFLEAVRKAPDTRFVTVDSAEGHVEVAKSGELLLIHVRDDGDAEKADIKIPIAVVDALVSPTDGTLDLSAALKVLGERASGDLITVDDHDSHVRIWIDAHNESN